MTPLPRFLFWIFLAGFAPAWLAAQTDPHITSWVTARSYARVYETSSDKTSGNAVSTWPRSGLTNGGGGQATVVYSDVQRVVYSTNYVYVYVTGLPSYTTGNWLTPNGMVYTSWPTNRGAIQKIPRNVTIPTTKQKNNGSGGVLVNGVFVWANGDAQSYAHASSTASVASISMSGDGIWNRLAGVAETFNFDPANGHQPSSGAYHNHINPIALRYQLGDNVTYNAATKVYSESSTITKHSPLIGWANDGLPIYGPYGYSSAMDSTSGVRRMVSGFVKRDSTNAALYGVDDLAVTGRVKLPVWAASVQGKSQTLSSSEYGPSTTATYALGPVNKTCVVGTFAEDYEYLGDFGKTQGVDFDLNRQNVRYCVTPEFPSGTYAYFVSIDSSGATVFPDIINQEYFGSAAMGPGTVTSINETVTEYVRGGQASPITATAAASSTGVKLSWTSVEGGIYTVASSSDGTTYSTLSSSVSSAGTTTTYDTATLAPYYKISLNAVATYDTNGNGGVSGVGNSASVYYAAGGTAPAITTQPAGQTVTAGAKVTFTVVATGTATLTYQWEKDGTPISGAIGASYVIASASASSAGTYSVVVTNDVGTVASADAVLTVNSPPVIATPPSAQSVTTGTQVTFSVAATGTGPLTYQWRKDGTAISGATAASYTLESAQLTDAGAYSVVVTNVAGTVTSSGAVLTVSAPPAITTQPAGQAVTTGAKVTFTVAATGTGTLTYQWKKNGTAISGATGASYVIASAPLSAAGTYTVVVTNAVGTATSADAVLTVTDPVAAPVITTQPVAQTVLYGGGVTFTVAVTSSETVTYQWKKNGVAIAGQTAGSYAIGAVSFADAGGYSVTVTNSGGSKTSSTATLTVAVPAPSISLTAQIPVGASASISMTGDNAVSGVTYYATGLPTGLHLNATTGQITGVIAAKAGTYTVTYWAQYGTLKSTVRTVQLVVSAFPSGMVGGFEGLLEDGDDLPVGKVTLLVTTTGAFTGTLTAADAKTYALKGTLALNADYSAGACTLSVSRGTGVTPYALTVSVSASSVLSATLSGVGDTSSGVKLVSYATGQTSPWAGTYTMALGDPVNLGLAAAPEGDGYATAKISTAGSLSVTGKLADGTTLTGTLSAGADGSYRCYLKPYKTAGNYLAGGFSLTQRDDQAGRYEVAATTVYWLKPASAADKVYPAGFGPVGLTLEMQKWVTPSSTVALGTLLGLGTSSGTLPLVIEGAGLSNTGANTYTLPLVLNLGATGLVSVGDASNPTAFNLKINTATGAFTGSFTLKDGSVARKTAVQGVLLQQLPSPGSATVVGRGYFLLSPLVSADPTLSGALEIALP